MLRAILFDMGGTLDGDGQHWLDRFVALYAAAGVSLPRHAIRDAFDAAERQAGCDPDTMAASFEPMVDAHVGWQLAALGLGADAALRRRLVAGFVAPARAAAAANARLLAELAARGLRLGVVSNGCGNVGRLCAEFGFGPSLSAIVDSRRVGLSKPDPAIFAHAAAALDVAPEATLMVGDSFDRDVRPAKRIGMHTAWITGPVPRPCPEPALADLQLRSLAELPGALAAWAPTAA